MRTFLGCLSLFILTLLVPATGDTTSFSNLPQGECPAITIETPNPVICPDARITFTASVTNGEVNAQQRFNWTISGGRITRGQGTPTITVATAAAQEGPGGVRANVELVGPGNNCSQTFSHAVDVTPFCPERKYDEYGNLPFEEEKARLGLFAAQLRGTPDTMGLIIIRPGAKMEVGESEARRERARRYMVDGLGLETDRILTREGDGREELAIELWIMPTKLPPAESNQNINSSPSQLNSNTPKPAGP